MKRLASMFLALCLILGMAPPRTLAADAPPELVAALADAQSDTDTNADTDAATLPGTDSGQASLTGASGTCGDNLTWTLDDAGTLTISGTGAMTDYENWDGGNYAPWYDKRNSIVTVVIESGVTSIGNDAFIDCTAMSSVSIPNSVTSIGEIGFFNCYSLKSVSIPQNVTKIGEKAFYYCGSLTSVTIPASVTEIGEGAFSGCIHLSSITVANGNSAYVSDNGVLFNSAKTRLINYPAGKADTTYSVPESVTEIGFGVFENCQNLTSVTIPSGVQLIELQTFTFCQNLKSVTLPASVTEIVTYAFHDCAALTDVYYGGTKAQWGAVTIGEDNEPLASATIHCTDGDITGTGNSGGGTSSDGDILAQGYCGGEGDGSNLSYVLTKDGTLTISGTGEMVYYSDASSLPWYDYRTNITMVVIESGVTTISYQAFQGCTGLIKADISNSVQQIQNCAFENCSALKTVNIPDGISLINMETFYKCKALTRVAIPASVTNIHAYAFGYTALTDVDYSGTKAQWNAIDVQDFDSSPSGNGNTPLLAATIHCTDGDIVGTQSVVTFNSNGGTWGDSTSEAFSTYVQANTTVSESVQTPTRDGYKFKGWFTTPDASGTAFDFKTPITQSLTLYAGWELLPAVSDCTVTFISEGQTLKQYVVEMNTKFSESVQTPTRDGYDFMGWFTDPDANGKAFNFDTLITGNLTLYAGWKVRVTECHVTFQANGGGNANAMSEVTVSVDASYTLPQCLFTPPENMAFRAWQCVRYDADSNPTTTEGKPGDKLDLSDIVSLILTAQWEPASVSNILDSGYCGGEGDGTNLSYVLTKDGTLTISGTGKMKDYDYSDMPWYNNRASITKAVMQRGVTSIGNYAFSGCNRLTGVEIPNGVTSIGEAAFSHCSELTSVKIPNSVITFIEGDLSDPFCQFCHCPSLTEITVADGNPAYKSEDGVLFSIDKTQLVYYPAGKSGTTYVVPNGVTSLVSDAFCSSHLTSITIPVTVSSIGKYTFFDCNDLTDIYYGGTKAQWNAIPKTRFKDDISAVIIHCADGDLLSNDTPSNDDEVLEQGQCGDSLTWTLTRGGTLTISGSGNMSTYSATTPAPWYGRRQSVKALVVASGVGTISAYAFHDCAALTKITAASSLKPIAPHTFDGCTALETVSFSGTLEQWDSVIEKVVDASDDDPLEFADVTCGGKPYDLFRALESLGKMNTFADREWKFPAPLARFRNLYIDVPDVDLNGAEPLQKLTVLNREEGMKAYVAKSGSTVLTIPKETFKTFEEGSHRITATFQTKANPRDKNDTGFRQTSEVYTVFPEGPIVIDDSEMVKKAVQDVAYTARLQTTPKLSDRFYRFEITSAQRDGEPLAVTTIPDPGKTKDEEATEVQQIGDQNFFFHPNGRFTGVPSIPGDYKLTVKLQVREETDPDNPKSEWYDALPDDSHENPVTVEIHVAGKTAENIKTESPGYTVIQEPPATLEQGTQFTVKVEIDDPADELVAVYLDGQELVKDKDYIVSVWDGQEMRLLLGSGATQESIQVIKTDIAPGLHSADFQWTHKDIRGNTETKNVARPVTVTEKTARGGGSSGGSGGSSAYAIKAAKTSNGKITLSATRSAAGKTITITLTPNSGYAVKSVSATDSKKKSVTLTRNGNKYTFTMPKLTVTVSATFAPSSHNISVSSVQHGKVTLDKSTAASGAAVNGTATPDNGYLLSAVTVRDASGKSVKVETFNNGKFTFLMPSGNVTVSATFTPSAYNISAASAEHGKVTLDKSTAASGTAVNGTTTPDKGYLLLAVTVRDASGNNVKSETFDNGKFTFLMPSGAVTVSATFTVKRLASFGDIQGPDWFFDDAEWAYQKGILRGVTEQYWEPQSRISAVTSVVTLERLDGVDLSEYDTGADDGLDNHAWYVAAARWAKVKGILPDGLSVDRDALSRGDFALMLANYLRYRGISEAPGDATFTDADTMSPAELDAFRILQKAGVFQGYKDGTIKPRGYLSRAHLSALLHRLSNYIIKAEQERFTGA